MNQLNSSKRGNELNVVRKRHNLKGGDA